jgi:hypothetical protein
MSAALIIDIMLWGSVAAVGLSPSSAAGWC